MRGNGEPPCAAHLKAQKSAQNAFKFGTEKNRGSKITAAKLRLPAKGGLTQFGGAAAPLGCAALTAEFLAFLLLLKTTIANSLTPWYYGVTKSESIG